MLPKHKRVSSKLFKPLLESKKYFNSEHFSLRVAPSYQTRIAVSVSKKISPKAVVRNKIRRRAYTIINSFITSLPKHLFLLIVKPGAEKLDFSDLDRELSQLFKKV